MARRDTELRIMEFISAYSDEYGYAPSYREIARATGLKSPSTVHRYIDRLKSQQKIGFMPGRARTVSAVRSFRIDAQAQLPQRIRLDLADGGNVCFDLSVEKSGLEQLELHFSGILDASCIKGSVSRIIRCEAEN